MKDHIKKELEKKGHSHPDLAAPLMTAQIEEKGGLETANIAKLQRVIDEVHSIMMEFGSNSHERARMADAENALYDAKETIQEKDLKGEYVVWESDPKGDQNGR